MGPPSPLGEGPRVRSQATDIPLAGQASARAGRRVAGSGGDWLCISCQRAGIALSDARPRPSFTDPPRGTSRRRRPPRPNVRAGSSVDFRTAPRSPETRTSFEEAAWRSLKTDGHQGAVGQPPPDLPYAHGRPRRAVRGSRRSRTGPPSRDAFGPDDFVFGPHGFVVGPHGPVANPYGFVVHPCGPRTNPYSGVIPPYGPKTNPPGGVIPPCGPTTNRPGPDVSS